MHINGPGSRALFAAALFSLSATASAATIPFVPWPEGISIHTRSEAGSTRVRVRVTLPTPCHQVASWGRPLRAGSIAYVDAQFLVDPAVLCVQVLREVETDYDLGTLAPGNYEFVFKSRGVSLKSHHFAVDAILTPPATNLFQIHAGAYAVIGGIFGALTNPLPNRQQRFVELTTNPETGRASLRILGADRTSEFLVLANGQVSRDQIRFHYQTNFLLPARPATVDYNVTMADGAISFDGQITSEPLCCDIPSAYVHSGVRAGRLPDLFTLLLPPINFGVTTNVVFPGDTLGVRWSGYNNGTACIPEVNPCPEHFGPALGEWQDAVFLYNASTSRLLGGVGVNGPIPVHGGYNSTGSFPIPADLAPGVYGIRIQIDYAAEDPQGTVPEQNEGNNAEQRAGMVTVLPSLSVTRVHWSNATLRLQLRGSVTQPVRIQASPALGAGEWRDLAVLPAFRGTSEFSDDTAAGVGARFYRAVSP